MKAGRLMSLLKADTGYLKCELEQKVGAWDSDMRIC